MSDSKPTSAFPCLAVFVIAAYAGVQMLADIASLKIGVVQGFAVDMGTFIYPLTFTLRDMVHKLVGRKGARTLVITAGVVNLFMAAYLWMSARVASDPAWGLHDEFAAVLAPMWRIVVASIVAEIFSQLANTEVYHWFRKRTPRFQWARVLLSNAVAIPVDNLIFAVGAFAGVLPAGVVFQIFMFNLVVKAVVGVAGMPLIYLVPNRFDLFDTLDRDPPK